MRWPDVEERQLYVRQGLSTSGGLACYDMYYMTIGNLFMVGQVCYYLPCMIDDYTTDFSLFCNA